MRYPTRFQQKTLWNAATGLSILILGVLLVGLIWLTGMVFGFLQPVLIPLIVAGIIAYVLDPVVRLLEKRGLSRLWSVVVVFIAILAVADPAGGGGDSRHPARPWHPEKLPAVVPTASLGRLRDGQPADTRDRR